ncbi:2-amino-4-hydroxy-6-hydroxymethyldihydropteridine diphosphokinase [Larsenimonas salina]|uniref:2-amino-4-hydroxy-6- hydroxymethyldihydropteridine diphosphokinase n=1 Tax=Larsenimonas salina TaxID=1295565 RepID=UPI002072CB73|nr:2-amino-4-hydroxy-6-hydroxymethyldihydropteridine diphosphokinase [Larsenimonas salina]MCM5703902.1 2-amino-4-hydroxy-6-hydroxymethyldihydropteridine diphosphokinase [Larsenimonas salina]
MREAFLGLGSNIDPAHSISLGLDALAQTFGDITPSRVFESAPVGIQSDSVFYNMVVAVRTELAPVALNQRLKTIEHALGRDPSAPRHAPRTLDIDLLTLGTLTRALAPTLPRRDILDYAFVLRPLAELRPNEHHPALGQSYGELWRGFADKAAQTLTPVAFTWQDQLISWPDRTPAL